MEREKSSISIFDIFKIGVGPSSSHTLGPWVAANKFIKLLPDESIDRARIHLYGSLSKTGIGHGTDIACVLGLMGYEPKTIDTDQIDDIVASIKTDKKLTVNNRTFDFDWKEDIRFESFALPYHPNGMKLEIYFSSGRVFTEIYYSVGGGFIEQEDNQSADNDLADLPFPMETAADLEAHLEMHPEKYIYDIVKENELYWRSEEELYAKITEIADTMINCIYKGTQKSGTLPGGLNVKRRAKFIAEHLLGKEKYSLPEKEFFEAIEQMDQDFVSTTKWVSAFALAVNEENADFGRIVTSPTNGAAGVIPAVFMYYKLFTGEYSTEGMYKFFLTAGEIGSFFKKRATISAAMGGCQAEIGVSSAMAAGALTAVLGGSSYQILVAAESAMEHHLGLTCDPIGGLVQIPCIERNTMGAMKAITASGLALCRTGKNAIVHFDAVVKTMWETALDMNVKYRETSEGGLAINIPVLANC